MIVGGQDTEFILDLLRSPRVSRASALKMLDALCRTAHTEGVVVGSKTAGEIINKTFGAALGLPSRPEGTLLS